MGADLTIYAAAGVAIFIAGISKGGFGGGLSFLATPLLALAVAPTQAAAIMLPLLILIDQIGVWTYRGKWSWSIVWPILVAAVFGIAVGAFVFGTVSADVLRLGLGILAIGFLLFQLASRSGWKPRVGGGRRLRAGIWGAMAGFTSTVSHAGGPPITIYLLGEKLEKTTYQACSVLIFWFVNIMKIAPYAALGVLDGSSLATSFAVAPMAVAGVLIGVWAHKRVSEKLFFRGMAVLLFFTGTKLIWDGAAGLL